MSTRKHSDKQERGVAKKFGTKLQIASGATPFYKGDGVDTDLFIECKTKMSEVDSISIKKEWLEKAKEQAYQMRKGNYILVVNFGEQKWDGTMQDYVVMEDTYFEHLYKCSKAIDEIIEQICGGDIDERFPTNEVEKFVNKVRRVIKDIL